ncbi:hypothetical protein SEA_ANNADREAMY_211 [Streptomyces phage Annadreamy]|uniref:S1 motif domain-containing protein n=2 Tax=Annadreamyvirus annadreamy TaxID=2846392 RepID=A0A345GTM4_9CAUD|nr:hypothetical protein HWB75_gp067 [Streptomyces phage Annadreamy]AXG66296.1 hypothetical protein SEA_ANNADREAMY_211 [Streptomyces phage Annadreamy]QGH79519.1 hypothetical protein SEA_LIMPID_218 [Streptomyces phage Limpid]
MGTGLVAYDTVYPYQVEAEDYVRFTIDGEVHEGTVLNVDDTVDGIHITLSDDTEGDADIFTLSDDDMVDLLTRETVEI